MPSSITFGAAAIAALTGLPAIARADGSFSGVADDSKHEGSIERLRQSYVSSALLSETVPLDQLATVRPAWNDEAVVRRNGVRAACSGKVVVRRRCKLTRMARGEVHFLLRPPFDLLLGILLRLPGRLPLCPLFLHLACDPRRIRRIR